MHSFLDGREKGLERQYAIQEEQHFMVNSLAKRLLAEWAARKLHMSDSELQSYVYDTMGNYLLSGNADDLKNQIAHDLDKAGYAVARESITAEWHYCYALAVERILH